MTHSKNTKLWHSSIRILCYKFQQDNLLLRVYQVQTEMPWVSTLARMMVSLVRALHRNFWFKVNQIIQTICLQRSQIDLSIQKPIISPSLGNSKKLQRGVRVNVSHKNTHSVCWPSKKTLTRKTVWEVWSLMRVKAMTIKKTNKPRTVTLLEGRLRGFSRFIERDWPRQAQASFKSDWTYSSALYDTLVLNQKPTTTSSL